MMSIERAEALKQELTDKWVRVDSTAPELKRFANSVGQVRTVNMNCRALVEFFGDKDVSWYDIAPEFLTITAKPEGQPVSRGRKVVKPAADKSDATKQGTGEVVRKEPVIQSPLETVKTTSSAQVAATTQASETQISAPLNESGIQAVEKTASKSDMKSKASEPLSPLEQLRSESNKATE